MKSSDRILKPAAFAIGITPGALLVLRWVTGKLGADPVAVTLNSLGFWTLTFLLGSLACTPLRILFKWTWPIRLRRMIGLFAFFYGCCHFGFYLSVDQSFDWPAIFADITKRKFIAVGFAALMLLVPLAITSTRGMTQRLGARNWKRLHRLAYLAAALGVVHFIWRVKADLRRPLLAGSILFILLAIRAADAFARRRATATVPSSPSA